MTFIQSSVNSILKRLNLTEHWVHTLYKAMWFGPDLGLSACTQLESKPICQALFSQNAVMTAIFDAFLNFYENPTAQNPKLWQNY